MRASDSTRTTSAPEGGEGLPGDGTRRRTRKSRRRARPPGGGVGRGEEVTGRAGVACPAGVVVPAEAGRGRSRPRALAERRVRRAGELDLSRVDGEGLVPARGHGAGAFSTRSRGGGRPRPMRRRRRWPSSYASRAVMLARKSAKTWLMCSQLPRGMGGGIGVGGGSRARKRRVHAMDELGVGLFVEVVARSRRRPSRRPPRGSRRRRGRGDVGHHVALLRVVHADAGGWACGGGRGDRCARGWCAGNPTSSWPSPGGGRGTPGRRRRRAGPGRCARRGGGRRASPWAAWMLAQMLPWLP